MTAEQDARVVIIGAGPAGLAAAIQLTRQGQRPVLLEGKRPGGLLHNANWVENYPGFPGGIAGPDLVQYFLDQARQVGIEITPAKVQRLDIGPEGYQLQTSQGDLEAQIVVVASGTEPRRYQSVPLPESVLDRVYYEVADLPSLEDSQVVILGAGDAALDYGLNLARRNQVTILNRTGQIKGLGLLWERVQASDAIQYFSELEVVEVREAEGDRLIIATQQAGRQREFAADYFIPAIGRRPAKDFLTKRVKNHLDQLQGDGRLFFIGDVANDRFRQTAIAVGDGLRVAMEIDSQLQGDA